MRASSNWKNPENLHKKMKFCRKNKKISAIITSITSNIKH